MHQLLHRENENQKKKKNEIIKKRFLKYINFHFLVYLNKISFFIYNEFNL